MITKFTLVITVFLVGIVMAFKVYQQNPAPWVVPEKNAKMVNPVKADEKSLAAAKALYLKNCADCHGKKGVGDGSKAADIKTTVADLSTAKVQAESDGELFYKISEGRKDMPRAKKDLPDDNDRWKLVNYVRTLRKK
jgi:mono/diheme cytochrome c family protein